MKTLGILNALVLGTMLLVGSTAKADLSYSQDFEGYDAMDTDVLGNDGWQVGANVFASDGTSFLYNYFAFPAPNDGAAFSGVATGEGGVDQGAQQLNTFNDYNNGDHTNGSGNIIDALVFRDIGNVAAADVGVTYRLTFDYKAGNLVAPTQTQVLLNTLDAANGFANSGSASFDTSAATGSWSTGFVDFEVQGGQLGHIFQLAFSNRASNEDPSGIFYDNISITAIPEPSSVALISLGLFGLVARRRRS